MLHLINIEQRLFVMRYGEGYSCLGFDVCEKATRALIAELGLSIEVPENGSRAAYELHEMLSAKVYKMFCDTGFRSTTGLNPKLIGLEGKKIEALIYGEKMLFKVGKSTGWIPCHLIIEKGEHGGDAIPTEPEKVEILKVYK